TLPRHAADMAVAAALVDGNDAGRACGEDGVRGEKGVILFPSPLVGEGGSTARSDGEPDEGYVSGSLGRRENPSSGASRHLLPQGEKGRTSIQLGFHAALGRRAGHQRVVPALDVRKILQLDLVARVAPGPAEDGEIGNRQGAGDELMVSQPLVEHAIKPSRLGHVALQAVGAV